MEKTSKRFNLRFISWHVLGWILLIFIYYAFLITVLQDSFGSIVDFAFFIFFNILVFYVNIFWLLPKSTRNFEKAFYRLPLYLFLEVMALLLLLTLVSLALGGLTLDLIVKPYGIFILNFFQMFFPFSYGLFLSLVYYGLLLGIEQFRGKERVKQDNKRLINEVEINRQNWLKAQMNPHMLFNILPMLRYTIEHSPEEAYRALAILNKMMGYYLKNTKNGLIPLLDEIAQVKNLMALNQIRWHDRVNLKLIVLGEFGSVQTIPMILLVLVENIYKYGVLDKSERPATIEIKQLDAKLFISTENWIKDAVEVVSKNIGLENLKDRLAHFYPDKHRFAVTVKGDIYRVDLCISLD